MDRQRFKRAFEPPGFGLSLLLLVVAAVFLTVLQEWAAMIVLIAAAAVLYGTSYIAEGR